MADAVTTNWDIVKPEVGASADTWGSKQNTNRDVYDTVFGGVITTTGSANAYVAASGLTAVAYSTQAFRIKANFTNSGAATLNLDGLGAKNIYKQSAAGPVAVASGDIVSGQVYLVAYDGTQFQILNAGLQYLDATLTALAALSWSSGNALIQFTAADTVALTLTPSVSSISTSQGAAATTPSATFVNTTDNANVRALRIEGDRATPTASDAVYASWYLSNSAGTQTEMMRIAAVGGTLTAGAESARVDLYAVVAGVMTSALQYTGSQFRPTTNDGVALGSTTLGFADLHLATGGVINWANGLVTITHDATNDCIEVAGGGFAAPLEASTETTGTLTVASRNRKVNCSGGVTLDDGVFAAEDWHTFDAGASDRTFTRAAGATMYVNGTDSATATLPANTLGGAVWRSSTVVVLSGAFY